MSAYAFEVHPTPTRIEVWVNMPDQGLRYLPSLWLRTRSEAPEERDLGTRQRLINPHKLAVDIELTQAQITGDNLALQFSDGLSTTLSLQRLIRDLSLDDECPPNIAWRTADWQISEQTQGQRPVPRYDWRTLSQDESFFNALTDFIQYGFLLLHNTPTEANSLLSIARRFGYLRETNFGLLFDVRSIPPSEQADFSDDLAYRAIGLDPHTDNPYRTPVPGIQLLHCLENQTEGGYSTLVDSLAVCATLKAEDPAGYALLTTTPLRFEYRGSQAQLVNICPVIEQDGRGQMIGVHFSPRLCDLPLLDEPSTRQLQAALGRLSSLFSDPSYELHFKLMPGELMMFDNNRVLHGRTAFDPTQGNRHLQGCYIDRDTPRSHYRRLNQQLNRAL